METIKGSSTLFIVDKTKIVKGSGSSCGDEIAYEIALLLNVPTPATEFYYLHVDDARKEVVDALVATDEGMREMGVKSSSLVRLLRSPILTVMEYIPPTPMVLGEWTHEMWAALGRILVLDVVTRNWDRSPLLTDRTSGNLGNLLSTPTGLVAIDNGTYCLDMEEHPEAATAYLARVKGWLAEVADRRVGDEMGRLIQWMETELACPMEPAALDAMMDGMEECVGQVGNVLTPDVVEALVARVECRVRGMVDLMSFGIDSVGLYGFRNVDPLFLNAVIALFP